MPATTAETLSLVTRTVSVAPLVLLSAADHFGRSGKGLRKRVVGVLLGQNDGTNVRVSNSFAGEFRIFHGLTVFSDSFPLVPFEEDDKDPSVWFLDHNYVESMNDMFKKVNAREKLIGWYHSGPKLRASDLLINELFKKYTPNPLLVIIDVQPKEVGVPTDAYFAVEEIKDVSLNRLSASSEILIHARRMAPPPARHSYILHPSLRRKKQKRLGSSTSCEIFVTSQSARSPPGLPHNYNHFKDCTSAYVTSGDIWTKSSMASCPSTTLSSDTSKTSLTSSRTSQTPLQLPQRRTARRIPSTSKIRNLHGP